MMSDFDYLMAFFQDNFFSSQILWSFWIIGNSSHRRFGLWIYSRLNTNHCGWCRAIVQTKSRARRVQRIYQVYFHFKTHDGIVSNFFLKNRPFFQALSFYSCWNNFHNFSLTQTWINQNSISFLIPFDFPNGFLFIRRLL